MNHRSVCFICRILALEHNNWTGNLTSHGWLRRLSQLFFPRITSQHRLPVMFRQLERLHHCWIHVVSTICPMRLDLHLTLSYCDLPEYSLDKYLKAESPNNAEFDSPRMCCSLSSLGILPCKVWLENMRMVLVSFSSAAFLLPVVKRLRKSGIVFDCSRTKVYRSNFLPV